MKKWIAAARLRTLPLAVGGMVMAGSIAGLDRVFDWTIFWLALATAVLLQILSNFANDYGDFKKGTDVDLRTDRALASGAIEPKSMYRVIVATGVLTFIIGLILLFESFGDLNLTFMIMLVLGLLALAAAVKYTMGKNPYGYSGKGDLMVFIFFGIVLVFGSRFLYNPAFDESLLMSLFPAIAYGCLSVGVLNVNNIRDIETDKEAGKITIAVKFGREKAVRYQLLLYIISILALIAFLGLNEYYFGLALMLVPTFLLLVHFNKLRKKPSSREAYNKLLKQLAMISLLTSFIILLQLFW